MILLLLAGCAVAATALLVSAAFPLRGRLANLLGLAMLCFAQIVLLSEILSELGAISRLGFLAGHFTLLALALAAWWRRGRPDLGSSWWFDRHEIAQSLKRHPLVCLLALAVLLVTALNLGLALISSPRDVTWDPLSYHLPRAHFWLQNGTARHYYTEDIRQIEFPPNASFCYLWIMALSGGYRVLFLPSWLAGLVTATATAGLARVAGHKRPAAMLAGLVFLTLPLPIMHMVTEYADLITAASGACFVFFAFRALQRHGQGVPFWRNHESFYAGVAFGLFLGSKLTAFFLLPGAALALAAYAWSVCRAKAMIPLTALAVACVLGFALLGAYNYCLNTLDFGNPITSEEDISKASSGLAGMMPSPELTHFWGNLARYVYQMMDWSHWSSSDGLVYQQHLRLVRWIDGALGLRMGAIPRMGWEALSFRQRHPNRTGYGPLGYAITVLSLPLFPVFLMRARRSRRLLLSALLLLTGWGFLITLTALTAWSIFKPHSFPLLMPMLIAGTVPWCHPRSRRAALALLPVMLLAPAIAAWITLTGLERPLRFLFADVDPRLGGQVKPAQLDLLRESLPPGSTVGFTGFRPTIFAFVEHLPELKYVSVRREEIPSLLQKGEVAAVLLSPYIEGHIDALRKQGAMDTFLVGACTDCVPGLSSLPFLDHVHIRCLYVPDPMSFLWDQRRHYGFAMVRTAAAAELRFTSWEGLTSLRKGTDYSALTIALPTPGLLAFDGDVRLEVRFSAAASFQPTAAATYNGERTATHFEADRLLVDLPLAPLNGEAPLQLCTIAFSDDTTVKAWQEGIDLAPSDLAVRGIKVVGKPRELQ